MYEFTKTTVDPDAVQKDPRISWHFKVECYFRDYCPKGCISSMAIDELCKKCVQTMGEEIETWRKIKNILDNHPKRT